MPEGDGRLLPLNPSRSDASEGGEGLEAGGSILDYASSASRLVGRATCAVSKPGALIDATGWDDHRSEFVSSHLLVEGAQNRGHGHSNGSKCPVSTWTTVYRFCE